MSVKKIIYSSTVLLFLVSVLGCTRAQDPLAFSWYDNKSRKPMFSKRKKAPPKNTREKTKFDKNAQYYLELAKKSKGAQKQSYQIMASEQLMTADRLKQAEQVLTNIDDTSNRGVIAERNLLLAELHLQRQNPSEALDVLNKIPDPEQLPYNQHQRYLEIRAHASELNKDISDAVIAHIDLLSYAETKREMREINNKIWELLSSNTGKLKKQKGNRTYQGWVELINVYNMYQANPTRFKNAIEGWRTTYPNHPGLNVLPKPAERQQLSFAPPQNIALLLPISGKNKQSAKAIQEGFFAQYYNNNTGQKIKVYDTHDGQQAWQAYQRARQDNANLIIGPLTKDAVEQISKHRLDIPVIALNTIPKSSAKSNLYQFGLLPELEVAAIVDRATQYGYKKAIIITTDNNWGNRIKSAFEAQWTHKTGQIRDMVLLPKNPNYNDEIKNLMQLSSSNQRTKDLQALLGKEIKIASREQRRQDFDVIFLAAPPNVARQVKPLLNFYYAKNIPVIATSNIFTGIPDQSKDRDLDGIEFCDMPWIIGDTQEIKRERSLLATTMSKISQAAPRLFAMGIDAYELANQIGTLSAYSHKNFYGVTGILSVDDYHRIIRIPAWAKFQNGKPVELDV